MKMTQIFAKRFSPWVRPAYLIRSVEINGGKRVNSVWYNRVNYRAGTRNVRSYHSGNHDSSMRLNRCSKYIPSAARAPMAVFALALTAGVMHMSNAYLEPIAESDSTAADASKMTDIRPAFEAFVFGLQESICAKLESLESSSHSGKTFRKDIWQRPEGRGSGKSCVLQDGKVFEKAGVNVSVVKGRLPPAAVKQMRSRGKAISGDSDQSPDFYAAGLSLVVHPVNPMAPTVHLNYRYFEVVDPETNKSTWWFGGGSDLTPSYLFEDDCIDFHTSLKRACDKHDESYFPRFKKWCDEYFYNVHRGECRGIGGIFFDDLDERPAKANPELDDRQSLLEFCRDCLESFPGTYCEIVDRRKDMPFTEEQKAWQQMRRGRYVEFNLVYDRGTKFGLATPQNARIESILMSLPLTARWEYQHEVVKGSEEDKLSQVLKKPRDWAANTDDLSLVSFQEILAEIARRSKL